jgi:hypothetical protein
VEQMNKISGTPQGFNSADEKYKKMSSPGIHAGE